MDGCRYEQHPDVCRLGRCIWPISVLMLTRGFHQFENCGYQTYGKHTNALQSSNILVEILHVGMDFMTGRNGSLE